MEKKEHEIFEKKLRSKFMEFMKKELSQTQEGGGYYKDVPVYTLETSLMTCERCYVVLYIWEMGNSFQISTTINVEHKSFATGDIKNHSLRLSYEEFNIFKNDETAIDGYITSIKESEIWQYITSYDYRIQVIRETTKKTMETFERDFNYILKFIGGNEIMRVLAPLNNLILYQGNMEYIRDFVNNMADIIKENRELKLRLNNTTKRDGK